MGMTSDSSGNIFIADAGDHRVRVLLTTGKLMTVAGQVLGSGSSGDGGVATAAKLAAPHGVALNGTTLFIADTNNNEIRQVITPLDSSASAEHHQHCRRHQHRLRHRLAAPPRPPSWTTRGTSRVDGTTSSTSPTP